MSDKQSTHYENCWQSHSGCALAYIERLEGAVAAERERAEKYREALELVKRTIWNSREAPNLIDSIDFAVRQALSEEAS